MIFTGLLKSLGNFAGIIRKAFNGFDRRAKAAILGTALVVAAAAPAGARDDTTEEAFVSFLARGDYANANFYLQNSLINPELLDTGQIFYDALHSQYWSRLTSSGQQISNLHAYLTQLKPFDINAEFACGYDNKQRCTLLHDLVVGTPAGVIGFFADLGLDLNKVFSERPPATYDIVDRLGVSYSIADIQLLSQKGMVFGDEIYDPVNLAALREGDNDAIANGSDRYSRQAPQMPHNYLSIQQLNFMDALAIALGNPLRQHQNVESSARDSALCQYITFVAPQMSPSFDYLRFVLGNRETFRASQIGVRKRSGNRTYEPFPAPCVELIAGMTRNHGQLNDVVAVFGARGDVETARWLLSLQASNLSPAAVQTPPPGQAQNATE